MIVARQLLRYLKADICVANHVEDRVLSDVIYIAMRGGEKTLAIACQLPVTCSCRVEAR